MLKFDDAEGIYAKKKMLKTAILQCWWASWNLWDTCSQNLTRNGLRYGKNISVINFRSHKELKVGSNGISPHAFATEISVFKLGMILNGGVRCWDPVMSLILKFRVQMKCAEIFNDPRLSHCSDINVRVMFLIDNQCTMYGAGSVFVKTNSLLR